MSATFIERKIGDVTIVEMPEGSEELRDLVNSLIDKGCANIILNVRFVDPFWVYKLIPAIRAKKNFGKRVKLLHLTQTESPEIVKILEFYEVYDDEAMAIASFN